MEETRFYRAKRFGTIFSVPRIQAKRSIDYMANALGVSKKTVQNWEKGISSPSFRDCMLWFRILDSNPNPYLLHYMWGDLFPYNASPSDENIDLIIKLHSQYAPLKEQLQMYHLLTGYHGSVFPAMLQMYICDSLLDLPSRNAVANMVYTQHILERKLYPDTNLVDDILPDLNILAGAISNSSEAIRSGDHSYSNFDFYDRDRCRTQVSAILSQSLKKSGKSQEYIALDLGVSTNTVRNWIFGKTEPTFFQLIEWFASLHLNPYPYLFSVLYPDYYDKESSEDVSTKVCQKILKLPAKCKRQLVHLFHGRHGSPWTSMLQMYICWSSLRLSSKIIISVMIRTLYESQLSAGLISVQDDIAPDMDILNSAIQKAQESVLNGNNGYIFEGDDYA